MRSLLRTLCSSSLILLVCLLLLGQQPAQSADADLSHGLLMLQKGDRISLIGNTLAERMQHDGWLETYLHSRFPDLNLSFRNLGFSGDELTLRLRSSAFGSPDEWLTRTQTDVVFAFFGYNESYADKEGLDKFKADLKKFIDSTLAQKYNGKSAPRLVLFSPIAHEDLKNPNLPDGKENNRRLALYTAAMAEVARGAGIPFVDLFHATRQHYATADKPLTFNGVHLTEHGNRVVAEIIDGKLFAGKPAGNRDPQALEKLRQAIVDKNFYWFHRYRTTDGYSIYGGRADLRFVAGQTNRVVMQREMEVLDVLTANRDLRIQSLARGKDFTVNDDNIPPFIPVVTNKPGPLQGGKHVFLDPEKAIEKMTVAKGMKVNLFASEKQFPELVNPVQMTWDTKGRLWVAVWPTYPHWKPTEPMNDKILILEDTDSDGKADKCITFADGLHCPTGLELVNGGVMVAQAPDLWFLKDTTGDDKADVRQRVLGGLCSADTHHASNSFVLDPGGALYFQEGTFHHSQVESPWKPSERLANAGVFRYEPRSQKFEVYVTFGFANPHGHVFDRWGQDIVVDGTGAQPYHAALFSGYLPFPQKHNRPPQVYQQRTRPCPGIEILSSSHFPPELQGNLLVGNVIGFQGILQYKLRDDGASFAGTEVEPIVYSSDSNCRPSDIKIGPDGAIYWSDWHNPIIGHMQHNLRDPSRDREHGRIYRVTYEGRPLSKPAKIAGEPIDKLLDLLKSPEDRVRYRTRIELSDRPTRDVIAACKKWLAGLDKTDPDYEHHVLEGLWLHQFHNVVDVDLLRRVLKSPDFRARAAATRVLCYWRDRVPDALALLRQSAGDEHPRVRLEAVRAASFFTQPEALEVLLVADEKPKDRFIDFVRGETMRALQPHIAKAIADKRPIAFATPAGARYFLRTVSTEDLLKMERTPSVFLEMLFRKGIRDEFRREALQGLARSQKKDELKVLLEAISNHDASETSQDESVTFDLIRLLTSRPISELTAARAELEKLATTSRQAVTRQLGYVALVAADGGPDKAWALASQSATRLDDFIHAVPLLRDPGHRAALYLRVSALLTALPKELGSLSEEKAVTGRYVRIELPGRQRTLTLAEVEVFSDGQNVARKGKASQHSTSHGGEASRAIDGNKDGSYNAAGQTHTREGVNNPWWEVDLGKNTPIQSIVVYNRTDGNLGNRLEGFTLKILDSSRQVVYQKRDNPAPEVKVTLAVGTVSPARQIRRLAMQALPSMRGQEAESVKSLLPFLKEDEGDRRAAVSALQKIPAQLWPEGAARPALTALLAAIRRVPVKERTEQAVVDMLQLADTLASQLPAEEARKTRIELSELGVRVVRLGTLVEQMLYDRERIVVQAGKPVEIVFENTDGMPHNLVFLQPGALEEVGNLAEATANDPAAASRHYVPLSKKILLASRLLQPREVQRISFTAPSKPGVYPYVCTYPGHWRRMHGALYVVADLDAYTADPEGYLNKNPLDIADPLLKFNRPRKEWKFEDLEPFTKELTGRSFSAGKQLFTVASCVGCHKFGGEGKEFGPDLTKMDPKYTTADVLRHILEPSLKIEDKYQVYTLQLSSGKSITGMILKETPDAVELIENPLAVAKPVVIKKSDIEERVKAPTSLMPKGLLDKLTKEEVLDLLAYVVSGANPKYRTYQDGHESGHGHGHSNKPGK